MLEPVLQRRVLTDAADEINQLGPDVSVQGNLDPFVLFMTPDRMQERVQEVLNMGSAARGHIFNLGHGILPETPVENVEAVVDWVHTKSKR